MGLNLSLFKCEIITQDNTSLSTILTSLLGAKVVDPVHATLLGSTLGDGKFVANAIGENTATLKGVGEKIVVLPVHDALILL